MTGKKVRLILKNKFRYSGEILEEDSLFLVILDKFGKEVKISKDSILLQEEME